MMKLQMMKSDQDKMTFGFLTIRNLIKEILDKVLWQKSITYM